MSSVSKEQLLAIMYGVLIKNKGGTSSQTFTGIPGSTLLARGTDGLTATLATGTSEVTLTAGSTASLSPGMPIIETGSNAGDFFATTGGVLNVVHSIQSATVFKVGNFAEYVESNLTATLATSTNVVNLTSGTTVNLRPGMKVTKISGDGAFQDATTYIMAITGLTSFTVGQTLGTNNVVTTAANHSTAGDIVFYAGGELRNHATLGAMVFAAGGIDLTNNQIPGLGDPNRQTISLTTSSETITKAAGGSVLVCLNGGNIETANATLSLLEEDYHYTGQILRRKLK